MGPIASLGVLEKRKISFATLCGYPHGFVAFVKMSGNKFYHNPFHNPRVKTYGLRRDTTFPRTLSVYAHHTKYAQKENNNL